MQVYKVFEDSKGIMWFCTDAGVAYYNGYSFRQFTSEHGLPDNTVMGINEDSRGRIWFYTITSQLFYFENDSMHTVSANKWIVQNIGKGIICSMALAENDTIYCGLNFSEGVIKIAPPYTERNASWIKINPSTEYFAMDVGAMDMIYGYTVKNQKINTDKYLNKVSFYQYAAFSFVVSLPDTLSHTNVRVIKTNTGEFVIATAKARATISNRQIKKLELIPSFTTCLSIDIDKNCWTGQYKRGINLLLSPQKNIDFPPDFLAPATVTDVCHDKNGGFWFTTLEKGVYYIASSAYKAYTGHNCSENSFPKAFAIYGNRLYSASSSGNEIIVSERDAGGNMTNRSIPAPEAVLDIFPLSADTLIICSHKTQMLVLGSTPKFLPVHEQGKVAIYSYAAGQYNNSGYILNSYAIHRFDKATQVIDQIIPTPKRANTFCFDSSGNMWVGCINGLWKYSAGQWEYLGEKNELLKNRIDYLGFDQSGRLWMATKGAGVMFLHQQKVTQFTVENGLSDMICQHVNIAGNDTIIASTGKGISMIYRKRGEWKVKRYGKDSGVPQTNIMKASLKYSEIWGIGHEGLFSFNIREALTHKTTLNLFIEYVKIGERKVPYSSEKLNLSPDENNITLYFFGLNYRNPGKLTYYYRLIGLDTVWHSTRATSVQFIALPPGQYTFELFSENADGLRSKDKIRYSFYVASPFWKKGWFIALSIILLALAVALFIRLRIQKINRQNQINRRIITSEMTALRAQMNPHFVFNAINSIQHFILRDDTESAHKSLTKFSKLIRNVLDNSKQETITLEREIETIRLYLELESLRFSNGFEYSIVIDPGIDKQTTLIAPMLIQPFAENAIWHGLLQKKSGIGKLDISIMRKDDLLRICIDDNGIGRKAAEELRRGSPRKHKPVGVNNTMERIELIRLQYHKKISAEIIDKLNDDGTSAGTTVIILIPDLHN
jgi:hypothetical protein